MNTTTTINTYLSPSLSSSLADNVTKLEAAIASGMVPNKLFTDAKSTFNHASEKSAEAFLQSGPHIKGRDGQPHHQSDWWLDAYDHDAFVSGTHTLHPARNRAIHAGLTEYAAFIEAALLPLWVLLGTAKPLIKKRGEMPVVKTAKQLADEADQMTCQCCGRGIFAATGMIAHHGYERPGNGYQTSSCDGARELPFEVSRDALGRCIKMMKDYHTDLLKQARMTDAEEVPVDVEVRVAGGKPNRFGEYPMERVNVTRGTFVVYAKLLRTASFDDLKSSKVANLKGQAINLKLDIKAQQARYDGWEQTHKRKGDRWVALTN